MRRGIEGKEREEASEPGSRKAVTHSAERTRIEEAEEERDEARVERPGRKVRG